MGTKRKGVPDKKHSTPTPAETKAKKRLFLEALATGRAPGCAAEAVGIARSTAYAWKTEDAGFAASWVEAVERSLDRLQTKVYDLALEGDMRAIEWELKWRRKDIYQNTEDRTPTSMTNYFLNVTQQEHFERLERLGLPVPVIWVLLDRARDDLVLDLALLDRRAGGRRLAPSPWLRGAT